MMSDKNNPSYLQSVTDSLSGHKLSICSTGQATRDDSALNSEAELLRHVWELVDVLTPPEPDDALIERIHHNVVTLAASEEIDDDQLDWAVGARKCPEIDPTTSPKER
ncbi:MAG TPA: hypothetical protein HPP94_16440 [Desulfuromonadales bacterium]|nr:hypothetical protein [Desulfuromonadales bacterium]